MRIIADIPDDIALSISNGISRRSLAKKFGFTEQDARYYQKLVSNGIRSSEKTILYIPDIHYPYHDEKALELAINYGKLIHPDMIILGGDALDFYQISVYSRDPKKRRFEEEIEGGRELLKDIASTFDYAEKIYIEGNHEMRLLRYIWSKAPELDGLIDVESLLGLDKIGWKYVINRNLLEEGEQVFKLGKLHIIHGHEIKVSYSVVNLARTYYLRTHVNTLVAHHHQSQEYLVRKLNHQHEGGWAVGTLSLLSPEFSPANNWNHGFAIIRIDKDGDFTVENKKIINGKIL